MIVENVFNEQLMTRADQSLNGKIRKEGVNTLCLPIWRWKYIFCTTCDCSAAVSSIKEAQNEMISFSCLCQHFVQPKQTCAPIEKKES